MVVGSGEEGGGPELKKSGDLSAAQGGPRFLAGVSTE